MDLTVETIVLGSKDTRVCGPVYPPDGVKWEQQPGDAAAVTMARVTAPANGVEITFLRAVGGPNAFTVLAL